MGNDFTLKQLAYFVATAQTGTTQGAADEMFVSQSAMSAAISDLESTLDLQLFVRQRGIGLSLTASGRELLPRAAKLISDAEEMKFAANNLQYQLQGELVVGCFDVLAPSLMPRLLQQFESFYPEVRLDFIEGSHAELLRELDTGRIEIAILVEGINQVGLERSVVMELTPHILLPTHHRLAGASALSLRELSEEPMIFLDADPSQEFIIRAFRTVGVTPTIRYRSRSLEHVRALVRRGLGFSLVVMGKRSAGLPNDLGIVAVPLAEELPPEAIVLCHLARAQLTRRATAFWQLTHDELSGDFT
ncbi:DNA-binding transcriptional LysR family regulator [Leucobacter exalbidus]|uniref:DNA-binding transcriptional LysR family regulator n=1 Tax=Leucobacter exalbidus TaxID=662960 RepID=A0A940PX69_9MICO|nr:LysR substrate-binding domain-containing protein [Leucobacter exalbidus]MBP1325826.1 DNA-binding transcriptional LysR family regulator [Leucobacter exalbidus]